MQDWTASQRLELQRAFAAKLEGEVRFDPFSRALYSTDASNHRIDPLGVLLPRNEDDLSAAVTAAHELNVPILPRGGGTSLAGQAIGPAVILDCSKYLNQIHEIDADGRAAVVAPGVTCAQLNDALVEWGLMYGPDPASANRATVGGMIGNNATGAHSIRYGMTADHVLSLDVTLADGSEATLGPNNTHSFAQKMRLKTLEGRIYRAADRLRRDYREEVVAAWPATWRRSSGYSLNYLTGHSPGRPPAWFAGDTGYPPGNGLNLSSVICGSEGTLAFIRRAEMRLVARPKATALVVLSFPSVQAAAEVTPELLGYGPAAVELIPRTMLERARDIPAYERMLTFVDEIPEATLVLEFAGPDSEYVKRLAGQFSSQARLLLDEESQANLWEVRKAGLGLLMSVPGDMKPITFIEDVSVPVDRLAEYTRSVEEILTAHGTTAEWYAHASAGCLHLRPMVNLKTVEGVRQMRGIADQVAELVFSMNGALSGEHGDGLSHTEFNARLFGPRLIQAFHELKRAFDPQGILNPGKVVPSERVAEPRLDSNLRYGGQYQTIPIEGHFAHRREGDLAGAVEACTGIGVCRKSEGVMCPSYQATRDEADLTRGRANALRAALSGALPASALTSRALYEIFDFCLECKGCKAECPTGVDIARIKAEFLALYQEEHGVPLRSRLFAEIHALSRLARPMAAIINGLASLRPTRWLQEKLLGIDRQRRLPPFQSRSFHDGWRSNGRRSEGEERPVVLFLDTYSNYHYPSLAEDAVRVLEAAGHRVIIERQQVCCGRPKISKGLLDQAKLLADENLAALASYAQGGVPIVGLEPSCLLTLRDEYLEFFPDDPRAQFVANHCLLLEEFLTDRARFGRPIDQIVFRQDYAKPVWVHTHCHSKAAIGGAPTLEALGAAGYLAKEIDSGCCGMAGSFGYEVEHHELSMQIGELSVLPAARQASARGILLAAHGVSCRTQILDGAGCRAQHPATLLAARLPPA